MTAFESILLLTHHRSRWRSDTECLRQKETICTVIVIQPFVICFNLTIIGGRICSIYWCVHITRPIDIVFIVKVLLNMPESTYSESGCLFQIIKYSGLYCFPRITLKPVTAEIGSRVGASGVALTTFESALAPPHCWPRRSSSSLSHWSDQYG